MSNDELRKGRSTYDNIDIGDIVESVDTGRLGLVKSVVWADGEPYVYGPYIVVIWVTKGYESCWIPHYNFKVISKSSKK
jgi:hypothetical protein